MWSLCDNLNYEYPCVRIILQTNGYANNRLKIYKNKDENSHRFAILGELFERERVYYFKFYNDVFGYVSSIKMFSDKISCWDDTLVIGWYTILCINNFT